MRFADFDEPHEVHQSRPQAAPTARVALTAWVASGLKDAGGPLVAALDCPTRCSDSGVAPTDTFGFKPKPAGLEPWRCTLSRCERDPDVSVLALALCRRRWCAWLHAGSAASAALRRWLRESLR